MSDPIEPQHDSPPKSSDTSQILTVPNAISVVRILCIPFFLWVLLSRHFVWAAVLFFVIAGTDFIDGRIARRFDQVSDVGKALDPTADRLLVFAAVVGIMVLQIVPLWLMLLILAREVAVSVVSIYFLVRHVRVDVRFVGKCGSAATMAALVGFIVAAGLAAFPPWHVAFVICGVILGLLGVGLGFVALVHYIRDGRRMLIEGRQTV